MTKIVDIDTANSKETDLILDRYKILEELASTRFSTVYKAFDSKMQRLVAIKMITGDSKATTWAKREAQLSAQLNHPNICTIYEYEETEDGHYLIMEYLEGLTLREILDRSDTLTLDEAMSIAKEVCFALEYAHLNYIVHQDIKPENVVLLHDGRVKLMDFGTARLLGYMKEEKKSLIGTPAYMSPEQVKSGRLDDRSDQFSLAVVIYEMLCGSSPFDSPSTTSAIFKVQNTKVESLNKENEEVSQEFADVIAKALSKKPDNRYDTMTDFRYKLERAHPAPPSTKRELAYLVARCSDSVESTEGTPTIITNARSFAGRLYSKNYRLVNRLVAAAITSGLGYLLFKEIGESYSLIAFGAIAALSLFLPSLGLLSLSVVAAIALALGGLTLISLALASIAFLWYFFLEKKYKFEIAFSCLAPVLSFVNLQIAFPIFTGLAFSPVKAFLISLAAALQVLVFSALWQDQISIFSSTLALSQLLSWPLASFFMSLIMRNKSLGKAVVASTASLLFLIVVAVIAASQQNEGFEVILKSASLSLIITMIVLALIPWEYSKR